MNYSIFDFVKRYCALYDVTEDDLTANDVTYIEDTYYDYCDNQHLPDYMRPQLVR